VGATAQESDNRLLSLEAAKAGSILVATGTSMSLGDFEKTSTDLRHPSRTCGVMRHEKGEKSIWQNMSEEIDASPSPALKVAEAAHPRMAQHQF